MQKWTNAQQSAIEQRGTSLLVSAGAGSGKTAVMIERIAQLILKGQDVSRLLVITFTNAAAAQMRERLQARLSELSNDDARLLDEVEKLPYSYIQTVHAFCMRLLRTYFERIDLMPNFKVGDEITTATLFDEAIGDALEDLCEDEARLRAIRPMGKIEMVEGRVRTLYRFLQSQPDPTAWQQDALTHYSAYLKNPAQSRYAAPLRQQAALFYRRAQTSLAQAIALSATAPERYQQALLRDLQTLDTPTVKRPAFARMPQMRPGEIDESIKAKVSDLRKNALTLAQQGDACQFPILIEDEATLNALSALCTLCDDVTTRYSALKREQGVVDFADLEQMALQLLQNEDVLLQVRTHFDHVFVDEYQDISPAQEALIARVAKEDNLFLVGDVKQSIYRFRQADPSLFVQKYHAARAGEGMRLVSLNRNFRSSPSILGAVNDVFLMHMTRQNAEIDYDEDSMLYPGKETGPGTPATLCLLKRDMVVEEGMYPLSSAQREALLVAQLLKEAHDAGTPWRDMVVLMRQVNFYAPTYVEVLRQNGIPFYMDVSAGFYDVLEVRAVMDVLYTIDNRRNDLALLGALRIAGGFSPSDLALMRLSLKKGAYIGAMLAHINAGGPLSQRAREFLNTIDALRLKARHMPVGELMRLVIDTFGIYEFIAALPAPKARFSNLDALMQRAAQFTSPGRTLGDFLLFVRRLEDSPSDVGQAAQLGERDDVVRIMSVHKAKGLEFPLVIGAGLSRPFPTGRRGDSGFLLHPELGFGLEYADPENGLVCDTPTLGAIKGRLASEQLAEEMRLLYVLMTRARDALILTGFDDEAAIGTANARCYLDWVLPAAQKSAHFTIRHIDPITPPARAGHGTQIDISALQGEISDEMLRRMQPPVITQTPLSEKLSVTRYVAQDDHVLARPVPRFLQGEIAPTQLGSAMHSLMAQLDIGKIRPLKQDEVYQVLTDTAQSLVDRRLVDRALLPRLDLLGAQQFWLSKIGQQALNSPQLLREYPFVMRLSDGTLLQGMIDLCYLKDEMWTIVDYKTDRFGLEDEQVISRHAGQLRLYGQAMQTAYPGQGIRLLVYLFAQKRFVEVLQNG